MRKNATKRENQTALQWLGLNELTQYAAVSERTLRTWIHSATNPLPAVKRGGKILVYRKAFDAWLLAHPVKSMSRVEQTGVAAGKGRGL